MTKALLLIDIQNIYFSPGAYLLNRPEAAAQQAAKLLADARQKGMPVIHVKHLFTPADKPEAEIETLRQIHPLVSPEEGEPVIEKRKPNAFLATGLKDLLKQFDVDHLVVAGDMTHMCVDTTVRACQEYGLGVTLAGDACATKHLVWEGVTVAAWLVQKAYLAALHGTFAEVVKVDEYLKR